MEIVLYNVVDGANTINKVLENGLSINVNMKNDFNVTALDIRLMTFNGVDYNDYNYVHIPTLGRYYFIDDIEMFNSRIMILRCDCDVLETYKADILGSVARFKRNIKQGDFLDGEIDYSTLKNVTTFKSDITLPDEYSNILTTVGLTNE